MPHVVIALGSNIDKERNLPQAVAMLREMGQVIAVAPVYESAPVGLLAQPNFWNTAVHLYTSLTPTQLKQTVIGVIETKLKRVRQADPNAPRTIDADIILYGDFVGEYDGGDGRSRPLPDPDLLKFPHVAVPVADLLPDGRHPITGERLADLAARLMGEAEEKTGVRPLWKRDDITMGDNHAA
ncbi:MAG: 2-amino-4-hydroxy-6-hydroxymethyldihydropteridine diphosphokinase [Anaerolineae bacterium]|nr:2-amino-4-hydroxy-6-hydroxymethyldihydropteridine diphosphokinase [Anaerolineae bacterium]